MKDRFFLVVGDDQNSENIAKILEGSMDYHGSIFYFCCLGFGNRFFVSEISYKIIVSLF